MLTAQLVTRQLSVHSKRQMSLTTITGHSGPCKLALFTYNDVIVAMHVQCI